MNLISIGLSEKNIKIWKVSKKTGKEELNFSGVKLDVEIYNDDINSKSKI